MWIEGYIILDIQNVELSIRTLADMRSQYNKVDKHWLHEVLYLRDVQKILFSAVKHIRQIGDRERKRRLVSLLKRIMHPAEKIRESHFPKIRQILVFSQDSTTLLAMNQYRLTDMRQLPNVWKDFKTGRNLTEKEDGVPVQDMQCALESAMKSLAKHQKSCEFLLGVATLRLFDFSLANFWFEYQLLKRDLDAICQLFETHLRNLDSIENLRRKQAYILRLSLYNRRSGEATAQYLIKEMPFGICEELKDVYDSRGSVNFTTLERKVSEMLPHFQFDIKSFMHSFQSQLSFLQRGYQIDARTRDSSEVADGEHLTDALRKLLKDLGMTKYYPEKLTFEDITTLTSDVHEDVNKKPTSLPELPWYFIKHVIGLDSDTREECHVMGNSQNSSHDGNDSSSDEDDDNTLGIHPLDLIYILFICADDFLRQELADKMVRCQYAIPFMFPSSTSKMMILHWALRSITRSFYHQGRDATKTLVDVEAPLVTFMNIGEETSWKSRLLNKMLSSQQETFWHQELRGGNRKQCVSHGMVEVAWYLPGRQGDNKFQRPVTFLNMRNNLDRSETVCNRLLNSSSLSCLFVDDIDDSLTQFLLRRNSLEKLLLVVLHTKDKRQKIKEKSANLLGMFQLNDSQIIRRTAEGANFNSVYEKIKNSIEIAIEESKQVPSLSTVILDAIENENMETDDRKCYHGHMAAQSILRDIDQLNKGGNAKEEVLPCQSDLETRRKMAELDKELCRQRKIKEDMTVVSWGYHIKSDKWKLQLSQLQKPISDTFKYFLQCLCNLEVTDRKYFLQCLKLGLNERSVDLLQPLYDKYERYRSEAESEERDMNLQILDSELMYGSLGVEHFFREMAILYENISTLQENAGLRSESLNTLLNTLSGTMASLLMDGTAVEIMDGDAVNVPVEWLKAVLKGVENSAKSTLFKVSAIGAQGSGKSTLLNTTFGLNFPVSSGRCTRGAYMQLLKVDRQLKKTLKCDYVAVIDSEGLMSRAKLGDCDYDNELSTLIIGLSDLTLVVFKDEGIEMQHVLPLAILVFLRMNLVGEHQGCHFVYEKRGAIGTLAKQDLEIDAFVRDLNKETLAAAKKVDQSDQYTKFTDVLQYDSTKDNTYIPSLYDGTEMGKTNPQHMKMTQRLKFSVVSHIEDLHSKTQKKPFKPYTFTEVASRLEDLWEAIKFENFVLGFKNVLAVEAHGELTKIFNKKQWAIKRVIRDMIQEENNKIENEILHGQSSQPVAHLTEASRNKLSAEIHDRTSELEKEVGHYFQCGGCEKCDATVANRKLLANNEKEFADEVAALRRTLVREVDIAFENLEFRMKADKAIHDLNRDMDETISKKVNEAITAQKGEQLPKEQVEDMFEALWKEVTGDILRHAPRANRNESIKAAVQNTLRSQLGTSEWQFYLQRESRRKNKPKQHRIKTLGDDSASGFAAGDGKHLKLQGWYSKLTSSVNEQDLHRLQIESDRIIEETSKYYNPRLSPEGRKFSQSTAEELFRDVIGRIENISDEKVKITNDYKVDLLHFIEERAVSGFTDMHIKYCDESSPEALLEQKKKAYHGLFVVQMGQGDAVLTFCNTAVKAIILSNLDEDLSCTELLDALKQSQEETLKDIKSIQASIMVDLMEENKFEKFISYITTYETYVKHTMKFESTHYFAEEDRLKNLAKSKLDNILAVLKEAVQEAALDISQDDTDAGSFINTFLAKIKALKIPRNEIAAFLQMRDVPGKKQFAEIVQKQLEEILKTDVTQVIDSWDVLKKLEAKDFDEFLFKEIMGCDARWTLTNW